jgi:hypothetical protein
MYTIYKCGIGAHNTTLQAASAGRGLDSHALTGSFIYTLHKQQLMHCCSIRHVSLSLGRWGSQVPSARRQGFQSCHSQGKFNPVYQQYTPKSRVLHYIRLLYCMSVSSDRFTSLVNESSSSQCSLMTGKMITMASTRSTMFWIILIYNILQKKRLDWSCCT